MIHLSESLLSKNTGMYGSIPNLGAASFKSVTSFLGDDRRFTELPYGETLTDIVCGYNYGVNSYKEFWKKISDKDSNQWWSAEYPNKKLVGIFVPDDGGEPKLYTIHFNKSGRSIVFVRVDYVDNDISTFGTTYSWKDSDGNTSEGIKELENTLRNIKK